jgi:hypothetical protein
VKNILFLIFAIVIPFSVFAQAPHRKGYQLIYEESFKGDALNTNDWVYCEGSRVGQKSTPLPFRAHIEFELDKDVWFRDGFEYNPEGIIFYDNGKEVDKCDWHELIANQMIWFTALNGVGKLDIFTQLGKTVLSISAIIPRNIPASICFLIVILSSIPIGLIHLNLFHGHL